MSKSFTSYISLSFRFKLENFLQIKSMKLACPGGLRKTPMVVGLELGQRNGFLPHVSYKKKKINAKTALSNQPKFVYR